MESRIFRIGHEYKDILSVSKTEDQFVMWFKKGRSGIGNAGGIRYSNFKCKKSDLPAYVVLITRNTSHRLHNPWEDIVDFSTGSILYWGDAKHRENKRYDHFIGNKVLKLIHEKVLDNEILEILQSFISAKKEAEQ